MLIALVLITEILFITAVSLFVFFAIVKDEDRVIMRDVLFKGAVGWGVAYFLRLIPLVLTQRLIISSLGGYDLKSILALSSRWEVLIVGPIFAGIFEEIVRFYTIKRSSHIALDHKVGPIVSGMGWALGEVWLLFSLNAVSAYLQGLNFQVTIFDILAGLLERFSTFLAHIALSFIIFYSFYEIQKVKPSILLAMLLHFAFDFIIVIWSLISSAVSLSSAMFTWGLEFSLFGFALVLILFIRFYVIPRGEGMYQENMSKLQID